VAEPGSRTAQPGWRQVFLAAGAAVAVVVGAALLTSLLPTSAQSVVFHTPLAIIVLIVGTGLILWRISRRPPDSPER
jgi:FtsH-binding integral membrane protein